MFCHLYYFEKNKGAVLNLQGCKMYTNLFIRRLNDELHDNML